MHGHYGKIKLLLKMNVVQAVHTVIVHNASKQRRCYASNSRPTVDKTFVTDA